MKVKFLTTNNAFVFGLYWGDKHYDDNFRIAVVIGFLIIEFNWYGKTI